MLQCAAVRRIPLGDLMEVIVRAAAPPNLSHPLRRDRYAVCELGENHDEPHAHLVYPPASTGPGMWVLWSDELTGCVFVELRGCVGDHASGAACELFAGHSPGHSFDVHGSTGAPHPQVRGEPDGTNVSPDPD
ncbi:hypothetical protein [Streptomyces sp. NPDC048659]|uniref:hypothetical protein n=1 Tax=Streptomyces sp. NPDC048659 TaxID=3155489 RepID=UPI003439B457